MAEYAVVIEGRTIPFTPPPAHKGFAALVLSARDKTSEGLASIRSDFDWLSAGISKDDDEWLQARLLDPTSGLEVTDVLKEIRRVFSEVHGSPTPPSQP